MSLTLLKSGIFPNENADIGRHKFTYSLFPHKGDFRIGHVIREGYILNSEIYIRPVAGMEAVKYSFAASDSENVVIETVRYTENVDSIILRMYECHGSRCSANIHFGKLWNIYESNMTEEKMRILKQSGKDIEMVFYPYEIKTILLERAE